MNRFVRPLVSVTLALGVSLGCYLVSAGVGAERARVAQLRAQMTRDMDEMASLDAQLHTRARLPQLQRWNDVALLMNAPAPAQLMAGPTQLVAYLPGAGGVPVPERAVLNTQAPPTADPLPAAARIAAVSPPRPVLIAAQLAYAPTAKVPVVSRVESAASSRRAAAERAPASTARSAADTRRLALATRDSPADDLADLTSAIGHELKAADASALHRAALR